MIRNLLPLLSILFFTCSALAQTTQPDPVQEFAYVLAGSKFYVHGGRFTSGNDQETISSQLFALDLSKSWTTDSAPWQRLASGPAETFLRGVTTADNSTIIIFRQGTNNSVIATKYNIPSNTWSSPYIALGQDQDFRNGAIPLIDPVKNIVYFNSFYMMDILDPINNSPSAQSMPTVMPYNKLFGSGAYIKSRRSFYYYGGSNGSVALDEAGRQVKGYNLDSRTWTNITTTGPLPSSRSDFCMVANEDGSKVVVFGGRVVAPANFTNTLYILDTASGQWTQGPNGNTARLYPACVIIDNQFILWGGADGPATHNGPVEIYSLTSNTWINSYTAPSYLASSSPSPSSGSGTPNQPTPTSTPKQSSSNTGAVVGGVVGGLAVIGLAVGAFFFFRKRENKKKGKYSDVNTTEVNPGHKFGNAYHQGPNPHISQSHQFESAALSELSSNRDPQHVPGQGVHSPMSNVSYPHEHDSPKIYSPPSNYATSEGGYTGLSGVSNNHENNNNGYQYDYSVPNYDNPSNAVSQGYQLVPGTNLAQAVIDTATGQVYIVTPPTTVNTATVPVPTFSEGLETKIPPKDDLQGPVSAGGYVAPPVNGPQGLVTSVPFNTQQVQGPHAVLPALSPRPKVKNNIYTTESD